MIVINDSPETFRFDLNGQEKIYLSGHTYTISETNPYIDGLIAQGLLRVKNEDEPKTENLKK